MTSDIVSDVWSVFEAIVTDMWIQDAEDGVYHFWLINFDALNSIAFQSIVEPYFDFSHFVYADLLFLYTKASDYIWKFFESM